MAPTCLLRKVQTPEHLSCGTPGARPLLWACSLVSRFLTSCVIGVSGQIGFSAVTPFYDFPPAVFSSQNYGMIAAQNAFFATLESCLFSHKWLFQELYFSVKFFFITSVRGLLSSMCNSYLKGSIWWLLWLLSQIRLLLDWIITCVRTGWNS